MRRSASAALPMLDGLPAMHVTSVEPAGTMRATASPSLESRSFASVSVTCSVVMLSLLIHSMPSPYRCSDALGGVLPVTTFARSPRRVSGRRLLLLTGSPNSSRKTERGKAQALEIAVARYLRIRAEKHVLGKKG